MRKLSSWFFLVALLVVVISHCTPQGPKEPEWKPAQTPTESPTATPTPTPEPPTVTPLPPLEITFVDNDCFLITSGSQKILTDAHASHSMPQEIWTAIEEAQPPFDDIDLILITHTHVDHFDPHLVSAQLERNTNAVFASTQEAVEQLKAVVGDSDALWERMRAFEPQEGERLHATLNGIDLEILNLPHGVSLTNLGFIISIGGRKLLHTGDLIDVSDVEAYGLPQEQIDTAFVPYFFLIEEEFLTEDGQSMLLRAIQAQQIIPMHYSYSGQHLRSGLEEVAANYSDSILFHEPLETQVIR